jgi:3-hydroxy-9,10-secoandrosta-1,3,5(10)-triene-9,17-dione monooxygenase reductase component
LTSPSVAQAGLKEVMRVFPQGVTVVTSMDANEPRGITVSAFTSVSLEPPLILISISKQSTVHPSLLRSKYFAVNFLADDQKSVSDRFAGRQDVEDRFEGIGFSKGVTGTPVIQGVRAVIECRTWRVYDGGDHSLLVGEVVRAEKLNNKPPLVFYVQQYTTTERVDHAIQPSETMW